MATNVCICREEDIPETATKMVWYCAEDDPGLAANGKAGQVYGVQVNRTVSDSGLASAIKAHREQRAAAGVDYVGRPKAGPRTLTIT